MIIFFYFSLPFFVIKTKRVNQFEFLNEDAELKYLIITY